MNSRISVVVEHEYWLDVRPPIGLKNDGQKFPRRSASIRPKLKMKGHEATDAFVVMNRVCNYERVIRLVSASCIVSAKASDPEA